MTAVELLDTDTERALRDAVRRLLRQRVDHGQVTASYDQPVDFGPLWKALAVDLGTAGLLVPEEYGGAGATMREAAVVAEEIGRAIAPVPFLTSSVIATTILVKCQQADLLARLASGELTIALATSFTTSSLSNPPTATAQESGITGTVTTAADVAGADLLLVPARTPAGIELHAVRPGPAVVVSPVPSLDMTRPVADVTFDSAPSTRIRSGDVTAAVNHGLRAGAIAIASEQVGVARSCLDATIDHVKQRVQFGRAIGSFQAVKHRLADLWVEVDQAEAAARYAAAVHDTGDGSEDQLNDHEINVAAAVAQSYCATVAVYAAEECVQLHGGIGMTWEHPAHLYLKRAKADQLALGTPYQYRRVLARLIDLPAS
jgi:alkylation response protein AidB-like acyl-CoA dehydrogenase